MKIPKIPLMSDKQRVIESIIVLALIIGAVVLVTIVQRQQELSQALRTAADVQDLYQGVPPCRGVDPSTPPDRVIFNPAPTTTSESPATSTPVVTPKTTPPVDCSKANCLIGGRGGNVIEKSQCTKNTCVARGGERFTVGACPSLVSEADECQLETIDLTADVAGTACGYDDNTLRCTRQGSTVWPNDYTSCRASCWEWDAFARTPIRQIRCDGDKRDTTLTFACVGKQGTDGVAIDTSACTPTSNNQCSASCRVSILKADNSCQPASTARPISGICTLDTAATPRPSTSPAFF